MPKEQLHNRLSDDQVKVILNKYTNKEISAKETRQYLEISKSRFYQIIHEYEDDPNTFSIKYERTKATRTLDPAIEKNILKEEEAAQFRSEIIESGQKPEEILVERRAVQEDVLFREKSEALKMPLKNVAVEEIPTKILGVIPEDSSKFYKMIPIGSSGDILEVGIGFSEGGGALEALQLMARRLRFSRISTFPTSPHTRLNSRHWASGPMVTRVLAQSKPPCSSRCRSLTVPHAPQCLVVAMDRMAATDAITSARVIPRARLWPHAVNGSKALRKKLCGRLRCVGRKTRTRTLNSSALDILRRGWQGRVSASPSRRIRHPSCF